MNSGKPDPKRERVRLRLVDEAPPSVKTATGLAAQMAAAAAAFEAKQARDPGQPLSLDETGLSLDEIETLRAEGMSINQQRAVGRRLIELGKTRDLPIYRRILATARVRGCSEPVEVVDTSL